MTKDEAPTSPKDAALTLARDWIAERPADRPVSAGKMISIIDRALAQPKEEPVGFAVMERPWVGLTEQEKQEWIDAMPYDIETRHCMILVNVIEAKLKEKNA